MDARMPPTIGSARCLLSACHWPECVAPSPLGPPLLLLRCSHNTPPSLIAERLLPRCGPGGSAGVDPSTRSMPRLPTRPQGAPGTPVGVACSSCHAPAHIAIGPAALCAPHPGCVLAPDGACGQRPVRRARASSLCVHEGLDPTLSGRRPRSSASLLHGSGVDATGAGWAPSSGPRRDSSRLARALVT